MSVIQQAAAARAALILKAARLRYAIEMPDGTVDGELEVAKPKAFTVRNKGIQTFVAGYLSGLEPGTATTVPYVSDFEEKALRQMCSHYAHNKFGKGNYITAANGKGVEVLRVV